MAETKRVPRKRPTKTAARKAAPKPKAIQVLETKQVALTDLNLYYKNPRIGNIDAIAESLRENGQYKAICVNVGTYTGRPNEILAGNHTYLGMKANGETLMLASFVDVDEAQATKIVLADNKTADLGTYDDEIIAALFKELPDISGTGYSTSEVDEMLANLDASTNVDSVLDNLRNGAPQFSDGPDTDAPSREKYKADRAADSDDEDEDEDAEGGKSSRLPASDTTADEVAEDGPVDKMAEMQVLLELREENIWKDPSSKWGIPRIPESSILEHFPKDLVTWIGHEFTEDKPGRHFLYNYSLGGTKGLDFSRTILAFNTYDWKFDSWWETPAYNLSRLMVKGLKVAVVPDFSYYYNETRAHHIWGVYRGNWLGRFFAEAGLKVVPRLQWDFRDPDFAEYALPGVPLNTPTLECSIQNINEDADRKKAAKQLRDMLEVIKPGEFLFYGGKPSVRLVQESGWKGKTQHVLSYSNARRESGAFDRKEGVKGISAKQKGELRKKYGVDKSKGRKDQDGDDDGQYDGEDD